MGGFRGTVHPRSYICLKLSISICILILDSNVGCVLHDLLVPPPAVGGAAPFFIAVNLFLSQTLGCLYNF